jgi:hypothetical protein
MHFQQGFQRFFYCQNLPTVADTVADTVAELLKNLVSASKIRVVFT